MGPPKQVMRVQTDTTFSKPKKSPDGLLVAAAERGEECSVEWHGEKQTIIVAPPCWALFWAPLNPEKRQYIYHLSKLCRRYVGEMAHGLQPRPARRFFAFPTCLMITWVCSMETGHLSSR